GLPPEAGTLKSALTMRLVCASSQIRPVTPGTEAPSRLCSAAVSGSKDTLYASLPSTCSLASVLGFLAVLSSLGAPRLGSRIALGSYTLAARLASALVNPPVGPLM